MLQKTKEQKHKELEEQKQSFDGEITNLKREIKTLKKHNATNLKLTKERTEEINQLEENITELREEILRIQQSKTRLQNELRDTSKKENGENYDQKLQEQQDLFDIQLDTYKSKQEYLQRQIEKLKESRSINEDTTDETSEKINDLEAIIRRLENEKVSLISVYTNKQKELEKKIRSKGKELGDDKKDCDLKLKKKDNEIEKLKQ